MVYRGNLPVVGKQFRSHVHHEDVVDEASVIQPLHSPEHNPSIPLLLGVNTDTDPFILINHFHGDEGRSITISSAVRERLFESEKEWAMVFDHPAKTSLYVHGKNWLHNDVKQNNVLRHFARKN